jgi:hypothetical protein
MTPIIVLAKERPLQLAHMVESIRNNTDDFGIIICNNASQDEAMIKLLRDLESCCTIVNNSSNLCFEGLNSALEIVQKFGFSNFLISDPDIIIKDGTPKDWPLRLIAIMNEANSPKVGLGLDVNFDIVTPALEKIRNEDLSWDKNSISVLGQPCRVAPVDTTMAAYHTDSMLCWSDGKMRFDKLHGLSKDGYVLQEYNPKYTGPVLRTKAPLVAYHAPWTWFERYDAEQKAYLRMSNRNMSSLYYHLYDYYATTAGL